MQSTTQKISISRSRLWTGRILGALAVLFLLFDSIIKILRLTPAIQGTVNLGYPESMVAGLGIVELACTLLYIIPRTSVLGAVLITGYLGGAIASNLRIESPFFSHTFFPVYIALMLWGGLYLLDNRLRALLPLRSPSTPVA